MTDSRITMLGGSLAIGVLLMGHGWGLYVYYPGRPPTIYTTAALIAGGAMFLEIFALLAPLQDPTPLRNKALMVGSFAYLVSVIYFEPLYDLYSARTIVIGYRVLVPMLLAIIYLVRYRIWVTAAGMTLFVLTCTAMLTSNINVYNTGSGFFAYWRSG